MRLTRGTLGRAATSASIKDQSVVAQENAQPFGGLLLAPTNFPAAQPPTKAVMACSETLVVSDRSAGVNTKQLQIKRIFVPSE